MKGYFVLLFYFLYFISVALKGFHLVSSFLFLLRLCFVSL